MDNFGGSPQGQGGPPPAAPALAVTPAHTMSTTGAVAGLDASAAGGSGVHSGSKSQGMAVSPPHGTDATELDEFATQRDAPATVEPESNSAADDSRESSQDSDNDPDISTCFARVPAALLCVSHSPPACTIDVVAESVHAALLCLVNLSDVRPCAKFLRNSSEGRRRLPASLQSCEKPSLGGAILGASLYPSCLLGSGFTTSCRLMSKKRLSLCSSVRTSCLQDFLCKARLQDAGYQVGFQQVGDISFSHSIYPC